MTAGKVLFAFVGLSTYIMGLHGVSSLSIVERWQKEDVYENLKSIQTGYSSAGTTRLGKNKLTNDGLIEAIANKYTDLMCGYAFSCLTHLEMIRETLVSDQQPPLEQKVTNELLFIALARQILATVFNSNATEHSAQFWLFYVYMEILQECIDSVYYIKSKDGCPNILQAHDTVDQHLRSFTNDSCRQDNSFNSKYTRSVFNDEYDSEKAIDNNYWCFRRHSISTNKKLLNQLIEYNRKYNVHTGGVRSFSYESLYFNNAIIKSPEYLQESFGVQYDWRNVFKEIKTNYDLIRTEQRPDVRSIRLGRFQNDFVNVLKAMMLRIVCKYILYVTDFNINQLFFLKLFFMIPYYNKRMSAAITEFMNFFHLEGDEHFEAIADATGCITNNLFAKDNAKRIVDLIEKALSNISAKFSFAVAFEPVTFENDQSTDSIVEHYKRGFSVFTKLSEDDLCFWLDVNITRAYLFIHYVQRLFQKIDLRVINSFIRFANDLETKTKLT